MNAIEQYCTEDLCEIYERLNSWEWDSRVGDEPEGYAQMPKYNHHWYHKLIRRTTKADYIAPILKYISTLVPEKELLRFHNVKVLGMTNENFEIWWSKNCKCRSNSWQ